MIRNREDLEDDKDDKNQFKVISNKNRSIDEIAEDIIENGNLADSKLSKFDSMSNEDQNKIEEVIIQMMIHFK